jgi:hypothetical protein
MATAFPVEKDNLSNPESTDSLVGHAQQHQNVNDAIEAIEDVIGITNSSDSSSITYKVNELSTLVDGLTNNTDTISELLGLDGNNDLTVNGIENPTAVDSFAIDTWRSLNYELQVSRGAYFYKCRLAVLQDGINVHVSESDIVSNTDNNLFTYTFEESSGIISLVVAPVSTEISVRFIRTAVKI